MIEINLNVGKKEVSGLRVAGIDPSWINPKMLVVAIVVWFLPDLTVYPIWKGELKLLQQKTDSINKEVVGLKKDLRKVKAIEKQIEALKEQEGRLARKLVIVQDIIKRKKNPFEVLIYIARNTPKDVWFKSMTLDGTKLSIVGLSSNFKSIGVFLENMKNSIFFNNKSLKYSKPDIATTESEKRFESFQVDILVSRFE
jgi:Tfp pilus assembly protein PilN